MSPQGQNRMSLDTPVERARARGVVIDAVFAALVIFEQGLPQRSQFPQQRILSVQRSLNTDSGC